MNHFIKLCFLFFAVVISGCQSLQSVIGDPNSMLRQGNVVIPESLNVKISVDQYYEYLGEFTSSEYLKYSDSQGGTTHNLNTMIFENKIDNSFIIFNKKTCNRCLFTSRSKASKADGPSAFFVDGHMFYRREGDCLALTPDSETKNKILEMLIASNNTGVYEGVFYKSSYVAALSHSYFTVAIYSSYEKDKKYKISDFVQIEPLDD